MKESFCCKTRQNLSINCNSIDWLCLEITNEFEEFNNFFTNAGPNSAKKFSNSSNPFTSFLNQHAE